MEIFLVGWLPVYAKKSKIYLPKEYYNQVSKRFETYFSNYTQTSLVILMDKQMDGQADKTDASNDNSPAALELRGKNSPSASCRMFRHFKGYDK